MEDGFYVRNSIYNLVKAYGPKKALAAIIMGLSDAGCTGVADRIAAGMEDEYSTEPWWDEDLPYDSMKNDPT